MPKMPAFQFYPGDWLKDPALRAASSGARGLWIDMLCLMWEAQPRGYLQNPSGEPLTDQQIARMTGNCSLEEVRGWLAELEALGVFSRTTQGVIYCRRLVRDEYVRRVRSAAGKTGAQVRLLKQNSSKRPANGQANAQQTPKQNRGSSSSISSSKKESASADSSPPQSPPPARGGGGFDWAAVTFPAGVTDTPALRQAIEEWLEYRRRIGKPYRVAEKQISLLLARYGNSITEAIQYSMAMGWQGCFLPGKEPSHGRYAAGPGQRHPDDVAGRGW